MHAKPLKPETAKVVVFGAVYPAAIRLGEAMTSATSSTAQDLAAGRATEIDSLNGYVARLGEKLGVATPMNRALATLVRLLEQKRQ